MEAVLLAYYVSQDGEVIDGPHEVDIANLWSFYSLHYDRHDTEDPEGLPLDPTLWPRPRYPLCVCTKDAIEAALPFWIFRWGDPKVGWDDPSFVWGQCVVEQGCLGTFFAALYDEGSFPWGVLPPPTLRPRTEHAPRRLPRPLPSSAVPPQRCAALVPLSRQASNADEEDPTAILPLYRPPSHRKAATFRPPSA